MHELDASQAVLRAPSVSDASAVWQLVRQSDILDTNSLYYYCLWFRDFADTSVVATHAGRPVGFVTGYVRPTRPDTLMAWQSAVDPTVRSPGLAVRMMHELADRVATRGVTCWETTVNPGNRAVIMMLRKFARERGLDVHTRTLFGTEHFAADERPGLPHPPEVLYRMVHASDSAPPPDRHNRAMAQDAVR